MKQPTIIILFFCLLIQNAYTQTNKPERVYSIVKVNRSYDWYVEQYKLWTAELEKNPNNPDGWQSYYTTTRMAKIVSPNETIRDEWYKKMGDVVDKMKKAIPDTYEYYYIMGYHEEDRKKTFDYALKAYEMDPSRPDTYDDLIGYYELNRQKKELTQMAKLWKASGDIAPSTMLWNYNMLVSTAPNAILFTAGDMDTYPAWIIQCADDVRTDVQVINTSLILIKPYRDALFKEMGIPVLEGDVMDSKPIIKHIVKHRGERPIYVGISANHRVGLEQNKLFNVGLAFRYDENGNDHFSLLIKNFEHNLLLDHLVFRPFVEQFPEHIKDVDYAYVPSLAMLHKHYGLMNEAQKQNKIKAMILAIVKGGTQEEVIMDMLEKQEEIIIHHCKQPK